MRSRDFQLGSRRVRLQSVREFWFEYLSRLLGTTFQGSGSPITSFILTFEYGLHLRGKGSGDLWLSSWEGAEFDFSQFGECWSEYLLRLLGTIFHGSVSAITGFKFTLVNGFSVQSERW